MGLPLLIAVVGPTGSGKSDLALTIAETLRGEIVNFDSLQLYRYLDIGTAKTPVSERRGIPHHLLDVLEPDEHFTAGDYSRAARSVCDDIRGRGRVPVMVGGTGFYLRATLDGLFEGPTRDATLRQRLSVRAPGRLHRLLTRLDPKRAAQVHANDGQKLIRALEVCIAGRAPMTQQFRSSLSQPLNGYRVVKVGLDPSREQLRARLLGRTQRMFEVGLLDEVRSVLARGFPPQSKALQSIGYRQALAVLDGRLDLQTAIEQTFIATAQYAKRQWTWFRRDTSVAWFTGFGDDGVRVQPTVVHHLNVGIN